MALPALTVCTGLTREMFVLEMWRKRMMSMRIHNLYADASGHSHFRDIEVEWVEEQRGGTSMTAPTRRGREEARARGLFAVRIIAALQD